MTEKKVLSIRSFIAIILLGTFLVMLMMVFWLPRHGREEARRAGCQMNLANAGKALGIYVYENNGQFPFMAGAPQWETAATGTNRTVEPSPNTPHSITAMMFLLVRDGHAPKGFLCPSDTAVSVDTEIKLPSQKQPGKLEYAWDFSSAKNCSYAWQMPLANNSPGARRRIDPEPSSHSSSRFEQASGVAIMADKPPAVDLTTFSASSDVKRYMSPHHQGEVVNYLRNDYSVQQSRRVDFGLNNDFIYTASGSKTGGSQYGGQTSQAAHLSSDDSYLVGPR